MFKNYNQLSQIVTFLSVFTFTCTFVSQAQSGIVHKSVLGGVNLFENCSLKKKEIAQVSPLYGCWRVTFHNADGIVHQGRLVMYGYEGIMQVTYWSSRNRRTETIEQTMRIRNSSVGILIAGYDPVWPGTNIKVSSYSPDNLLFSILPNGNFVAVNCGDNMDCSPVQLQSCE